MSADASKTPSEIIDGRIAQLGDWRGETLARVRALVKQAVPQRRRRVEWRGVPVWSHGGILCTGETYKAVVKLTFAKGGNTRRAIGMGEAIDEAALMALMRAAAALNAARGSR